MHPGQSVHKERLIEIEMAERQAQLQKQLEQHPSFVGAEQLIDRYIYRCAARGSGAWSAPSWPVSNPASLARCDPPRVFPRQVGSA